MLEPHQIECGATVRYGETAAVISAPTFQPAGWPGWVSIDVADSTGCYWTGERWVVSPGALALVAEAPRDRSFYMGNPAPANR